MSTVCPLVEPGPPSGRRAAAGRGALAARRDMATQHDEWTPPVDGAPAVAGAPSRTLSSRGASPSCIVRSTAGWATALERWRGGKARVFDCAIGVQSVLSRTHAHPTCASSPRTSRALLGNRQAPSPPPEMPMVTTALAVPFCYQGTVAETETFTKSRERTSPTCGTSTDESTQEKGLRANRPIWYGD